MKDSLILHVQQKLSAWGILPGIRIGVGVSGGADSMVLLEILRHAGFDVTALHVNFKLRGSESDADAAFISRWCVDHGIPCHIHEIDAEAYATANRQTIQVAAREIRYAWWSTWMISGELPWIAIAHNLDDQVETAWMRMLRGTGLQGLAGIPARREGFIRPLLDVSAETIRTFARAQGIPFREDSSNVSQKYRRNAIRHTLMPLLDQLQPNHRPVMTGNVRRWQAERAAWAAVSPLKVDLMPYGIWLYCPGEARCFLAEWLEGRGIPWRLSMDFLGAARAQSGILRHGSRQLIRADKDNYVLLERLASLRLQIQGWGEHQIDDRTLLLTKKPVPDGLRGAKHDFIAWISLSALQWPLQLRAHAPGDRMHPFGLQGHSRKVQDLMTDAKWSPFQKQRAVVLISGEKILWIPGLRLAEEARILPGENEALEIRLLHDANPTPGDLKP